MATKNLGGIKQAKELEKIDKLKDRLLGTDREDHWKEVLDIEQEIKRELLKKDLTKHKGMQMLIDWMIQRVRDARELLARAKSKDLTDSQRDGLIEVTDFIVGLIRFLDPKGLRLAELNKELDFQLEDPEDAEDDFPEDVLTDAEDSTEGAPKK